MRFATSLLSLAVCLSLTGCDSAPDIAGDDCVVTVHTESAAPLETGDSLRVRARFDRGCRDMPTLQWSTSDSLLAVVTPTSDTTATIRSLAPGDVRVIATHGASRVEVAAPLSIVLTRDATPWQTSALEYQLRDVVQGAEVSIPYTFTNSLPGTVSIEHCNSQTLLHIERWTASGWQMVWPAIIPLCQSPPIAVAPAQTFGLSLWVFGGYTERTLPRFLTPTFDGVHRIVWQSAHTGGQLLPFEQRISNRFVLKAPR